ncbi:MAG TPA: MBL fold metallo-hydrolase [Candidatus Dormibacteraeota bacterium]|nr:MBL fold metallo-hydrolase [Candidatus Dormibacteraeota bacterium]
MFRPDDLFFPPDAALSEAGAVRLTWLGTAGFAIEHDGHVLLLDPYLTRVSLSRCLLAPLRADQALARRVAPRADAIVLSHTHFDHALDAPLIARQTGARVFGSRSAVHLCRSHGLPDAQLVCVEPIAGGMPHHAEVGPFRLRFWPSAHSALLFGRVPFPGEIADCTDVPLRTEAYRCGAVFGVEIEVGGRRLFHVGSAELVERDWRIGAVDLVLACVAGWTATDRYPERLLAALSPGAVLLHHWDNFLRGLDAGAHALPAIRMPILVDRLHAAAPHLPVGTLPLLGSMAV